MKRVASFLCALALCCTLLPVPAGAVEAVSSVNRLSPEQAEAYYGVLQGHISTYGSYAGPKEVSEVKSTGLAYAELLDFDGDQVPELYDFFVSPNGYGEFAVHEEIWKWDGGKAVLVHDKTFFNNGAHAGDIARKLCGYEGKAYLASCSHYAGQGSFCTGLTIETLLNGQMVEELSQNEAVTECTPYGEIFDDPVPFTYTIQRRGAPKVLVDTTLDWSAHQQTWPSFYSAEAQAEADRYGVEAAPILIDTRTYTVTSCASNDVEKFLSMLYSAMPPDDQKEAVLRQLPYLGGDVSQCKMNRELARQYLAVLEQVIRDGVYCTPHQKKEYVKNVQAILCDIAGDGNPILIIKYDVGTAEGELYGNKCIQMWDSKGQVCIWPEQLYNELDMWDTICLSQVTFEGKPYFEISIDRFTTNLSYFPEDVVLLSVNDGNAVQAHTFTDEQKDTYSPGDEKSGWYLYSIEFLEDYNQIIEACNNNRDQETWQQAYLAWKDLIWGLDALPWFSNRYSIDNNIVSPEQYYSRDKQYRLWFDTKENIYFFDKIIHNTGQMGDVEWVGEYLFDAEFTVGEDIMFAPASDCISALTDYINYSPAPTSAYPYAFGTLTEAQVSGIAKALADRLGGEVTGVYKLAEDLYYVVVRLTGGDYGGAVVKESRTGFRVLLAQETPIEDGDLAPFAAEAVTKPNLTVDYGQIGGFTAVADYIGYLGQLLEGVDGTAPNAPAKGELTAYAEAAVSRLSGATVKAKGNRVTITGKTIETAAGSAQEARDQLSGALADSGVALNKPITILLRIEGQNINLEKPVQVTLDPTVLDAMGEAAAIQLLLGDGSHSVKLTAESLKALLGEYGKVSVQLARTEEGVYTITFADKTGATLDKLPADVTFSLPAESGWATVLASYQGGSDNWGGQYDAVNGALEFSTKFSGQYEVLKNDLDISDLEDCSDQVRAAVRFMVSKGYFDLTEGAFLPTGELTRYDFTAALVKMFFALDRSLETSFPDVPQEGPYYDYVASAEHGNIVKGYADGTFSGGDAITGEQVLALCARTLAERKGYLYPEDPEQYLSGPGRADTSGWAREAVALAVREGLIHPEEDFAPAAPMTRGQSAQVLYRLFMLLYETSPVAFEVRPAGAEFPVVPVIAGGAVVVLLAGGGCWFLFRRKKRTPVG